MGRHQRSLLLATLADKLSLLRCDQIALPPTTTTKLLAERHVFFGFLDSSKSCCSLVGMTKKWCSSKFQVPRWHSFGGIQSWWVGFSALGGPDGPGGGKKLVEWTFHIFTKNLTLYQSSCLTRQNHTCILPFDLALKEGQMLMFIRWIVTVKLCQQAQLCTHKGQPNCINLGLSIHDIQDVTANSSSSWNWSRARSPPTIGSYHQSSQLKSKWKLEQQVFSCLHGQKTRPSIA